MILEIDGWKFQVFDVATRKYYVKEVKAHCTCGNCRNFYATIDSVAPELRPFLAKFGVHIEAPDEMVSFSPTLCSNYYGVCGQILEKGDAPLLIGGITLEPLTEEEAMCRSDCPEPRFYLCAANIMLPWVLNEPMDNTDSPAKEQDAIARLLGRWISDT